MSLKLNERYPGRFNNPSAQYPQGSFKNRTAPNAKDGSYLEQDWANDKEGFFQSLLSAAGIGANGAVDKVGASQAYDALIILAGNRIKSVKRQVITASGTYTPSPGMVFCDVELIGGGGGGGGSAGAAGQGSGGSGGGSGGYCRRIFTAAFIGGSVSVTIGGGGAGGAAGTNVGSSGGTSLFAGVLAANGGGGGGGGSITTGTGGNSQGGVGGASGGGDLNGIGQAGSAGLVFGSSGGLGGAGGSSPYGSGGSSTYPTSLGGIAGSGFGAGGSGATSTTISYPGGTGAPGFALITEYCTA